MERRGEVYTELAYVAGVFFFGKDATEGRPSERWSYEGGNNTALSF